MKFLLKLILKLLAKATLAKYCPRIVGITGSVGKTGSRLAVAAVLRQRFSVGEPAKNLNNEIGLPLAILGEQDSGYRSLVAWLGIFVRAFKQLIVKNSTYPEILVLEYGVDRPGDMDYLLSVARPEVAVLTAVSPTHLEFLQTVEGVAREKGKLVLALPATGTAVLNVDYPQVAALVGKGAAKVLRYGSDNMANVRAQGVSLSQDASGAVQGVSFRLSIEGSTVPVLVRGTIGTPAVSMAMAGAAVGLALGLSVLEVTRGLAAFVPPPGRLSLIEGVHGTTIIDDTYNSSPEAVRVALLALGDMPCPVGARRWAVLGDMLELGKESEVLHRAVGEEVAKLKIDYLVTVGEQSRDIARGAIAAGLSEQNTWHVPESSQAGKTILESLLSGDVVLVKGSQGVLCERVVKDLMAAPRRAGELLVRQSKPWV
ncbi:MAG: UDP-N-acetylmuramoyl-tripeptide--D-alanyl-D-alanine ligase [Candidatus Veblenbacteria bacterium]|nr:UDP-N-acetylmuramoyl-tripeptide--D-alanyl-D-alanine ligase [Candidatus Veblenbacteria bacterium]